MSPKNLDHHKLATPSLGLPYDPHGLSGATIAERYTLLEPIGRGGMGVVYLARHDALEREVAVKVIASRDAETTRRFEREARGLSSIQHPNVVTLYDFGTERGLTYLVMEYVRGETLSARMRRAGPIELTPFGRLAVQIAAGLGEAHEHGLVHRDVKPSNIMLSPRKGCPDRVKILDFGLAKLAQGSASITQQQHLVGSTHYLAPEHVLGEPCDARSDIYALGIIFWSMLCGEKPFDADDNLAILYQHVHDPPPPLSLPEGRVVPGALAALIASCLAKDPADRPRDGAQVVDLLIDALPEVDLLFVAARPSSALTLRDLAPPSSSEFEPEHERTRFTPRSSDQIIRPATEPSDPSGALREMSGLLPTTRAESSEELFVPAPRPGRGKRRALWIGIASGALLLGAVALTRTLDADPVPPPPAPHDTRARAHAILERAEALIEARKWGQAEDLLRTAGPLAAPHPELLVRAAGAQNEVAIGTALERARMAEERGDLDAARALVRDALARDPAHARALTYRARLAAPRGPATIAITSPRRASVWIDGARRGRTPLTLELPAGSYDVELRAHDHAPFRTTVAPKPGESLSITAEFVRAPEPRPRAQTKPLTEEETPKKEPLVAEQAPEPEPAAEQAPEPEPDRLLSPHSQTQRPSLFEPRAAPRPVRGPPL